MSRKTHTHQYRKVAIQFKYGKKYVWACSLGNCNHYMPPHLEHLVLGKNSICFECGKEFRLTNDAMAEDMPRCNDCRAGISGNILVESIANDVDDL